MGILDSIFGKKSNPGAAASPFLSQIPSVGFQQYSPYINQGFDSGNRAKGSYDEMVADPVAFLNKIMKGFEPSEGYNFEKDLLTKQLSNTANAGGIAGTPYDQLNQGEAVHGLLSKDMQQFLENAFGIQKTGLAGEQHTADTGFEASKALTDLLGGSMNQQGGLAFNSAQQKNTDRSGIISMLAKALGAGAGALFGGAPGAVAGSKIFGSI